MRSECDACAMKKAVIFRGEFDADYVASPCGHSEVGRDAAIDTSLPGVSGIRAEI